MFRLIENRTAANPFYHEAIAVHLYTLDELCYFLKTHMYLIDRDWFGEELFSWLGQELHYETLAAGLRQCYRSTKDIFRCAEQILQASGNYGAEEMEQIHQLLEAMNGKTAMERRKMRGDLLLEAKKYRQAAYIYMELLEPEYTRQMTEELKGNIIHNLGVAYARLFLFPEAAQMFVQAYHLRRSDETRQAYLYAMNYVGENDPLNEQGMDLNFSVMKDTLNHLSEVSDRQEFYRERREASRAADAFDWKSRQKELIGKWKADYKSMIL